VIFGIMLARIVVVENDVENGKEDEDEDGE
jgi:hypothetical protein